ncbi:MAG: SCP2 sterol-binding domain-containing protein [Chloroflexi bacterium]|nr:SCP2 sterol-binding domain-containing protein [Chloroflexota bacterium]MBP7041825.1 SCP2 sterol-binding domain-containing protein [Chloroflexota bacterium]
MTHTNTFPTRVDALANPHAVVQVSNGRFTILTPRLLRLEYSPNNQFEDRPSQAFWYRRQPVPEFQSVQENGRLTLQTAHLQLDYAAGPGGFTADTLSITLKSSGQTWQYGQTDPLNLLGTARTLDDIDGALGLEQGLLSRAGWAVYDDTHRLVFNQEGWLEQRHASEGYRDLYFFGYGHDFAAALPEFARIAGPAPLIPRWALGNWWSRYWAYSANELLGVMDEFKAHNVPLSVCIVDMDWHITKTGNAASGWTGYTWNRDLFPDPPAFIAALHQRGLKTALNLHPADGIYPHEAQYEAMALWMGQDPEKKSPVPFNIASPHFTQGYFNFLHHPKEADGVDFWWMDWQQGVMSDLPGLDPLWWLNHLHFHDLGRDGTKRPFIFSRWGGLGNHRYPIGFSGDTHITWDSLAFQPYFTATAANVNYGWWSHDIGGHMSGIEEPELFARWVQFGLLSPILRLHSTNNRYHERRPWGHDAETARITAHAMRLRHALIPYLYTMAWRNHTQHLPLVRPMYHDYPTAESAYHCPDQYSFGSELIAAPFLTARDADTCLSRQVVWLPAGAWFDFFHGDRYAGDGWQAVYGRLDDIPLFAKAGAIVPLAAPTPSTCNDTANPAQLEIHCFPGRNNIYWLYEDDGLRQSSLIPISQTWSPQLWSLTVGPADGSTGHLPPTREFGLLFRQVGPDTAVAATLNHQPTTLPSSYDAHTATLRITAAGLTPHDTLAITLSTTNETLMAGEDGRLPICRRLLQEFRLNTRVKESLYHQMPQIIDNPSALEPYTLSLTTSQRRALLEIITGAGGDRRPTRRSQDEVVLLWQNGKTAVSPTYKLLGADLNGRAVLQKGPVPHVAALTLGAETLTFHTGDQPSAGRITVDGWFDGLVGRLQAQPGLPPAAAVQFDIAGENGRIAAITLQEGQIHLVDGRHPEPSVTIAATAQDWLALINGETTPEALFLQGKLNIQGSLELALLLAEVISIAPPSKLRAEKWRLEFRYQDLLEIVFA